MNYLDISKASDISNSQQRILYRFLELLPAFLSLGALTLLVFLSRYLPTYVAIFVLVFDLYWLFRATYYIFFKVSTFRRLQESLKEDWVLKLNEVNKSKSFSLPIQKWQDIYQLVILPNYKEDEKILIETLESLKNAIYPKEKMIVVLACEERAGEERKKIAQKLEKEYQKYFFKFLSTFHPANIPGEAIGRGSNVSWAIKEVKKRIIDPLNILYQNILISIFDIDTHPYPQYFLCLTYHYLTVEKPLQSAYQPIPVYNNNIWEVPAFSRIISVSGTFWQMIQQMRPNLLVTFSSHSIPFQTAVKVKYPNNLIPDDSRIFWKAFLFYNGDYKVVPLYYPVSMDAVQEKNYWKTTLSQYKQLQRWAWGCTDIPYLIFNFLKNKKIPLKKKIFYTFNSLEGHFTWATASLTIFLFGWLPLILGGEKFNSLVLAYNLPRLSSKIMSVAMVGILVAVIINFLLLPPRPPGKSRLTTIIMIFQWLLLPLTLIVFGSLPALDAQIRLFLGRYLEFWPTPKVRN